MSIAVAPLGSQRMAAPFAANAAVEACPSHVPAPPPLVRSMLGVSQAVMSEGTPKTKMWPRTRAFEPLALFSCTYTSLDWRTTTHGGTTKVTTTGDRAKI